MHVEFCHVTPYLFALNPPFWTCLKYQQNLCTEVLSIISIYITDICEDFDALKKKSLDGNLGLKTRNQAISRLVTKISQGYFDLDQ